MFDPALFERSADIRGIYPNQINEELAFLSGRYLVRSLKPLFKDVESLNIIVGRDGRTSSMAIYSALIQGIAAEGGTPIPAGLATTDMIQWAVGGNLAGSVAGAMITASHNPAEYNGIKMLMQGPDGQLEIVRPVDHLAPRYKEDGEDGSAAETAVLPYPNAGRLDLQEKFVEAALSRSDRLGKADGKVVLDPGNGVGGIFRRMLREGLTKRGAPIELLAVAERIDGTFPTRPSNPSLAGAVKLLQEKVIEVGAKFGAAFDGDADRVFLVDEWGQFVSGSVMLAALAKSMVEKSDKQDAAVVYSAVSSWLVPQTVHAAGGRPIISRVGQDAAKVALVKTDAVFGGESSAHYNFPDTYCLDSGLFALVTFWDMLLESGLSCSELLGQLKPWPNSGEVNLRFECEDWKAMSKEVIGAVQSEYTNDEHYILDIDGVSVFSPTVPEFKTVDDVFTVDPEGDPTGKIYRVVQDYTPDWWFNIRASNNEPLLRLNVESKEAAEVPGRTYSLISHIRKICGNRATVTVQDWGNLK